MNEEKIVIKKIILKKQNSVPSLKEGNETGPPKKILVTKNENVEQNIQENTPKDDNNSETEKVSENKEEKTETISEKEEKKIFKKITVQKKNEGFQKRISVIPKKEYQSSPITKQSGENENSETETEDLKTPTENETNEENKGIKKIPSQKVIKKDESDVVSKDGSQTSDESNSNILNEEKKNEESTNSPKEPKKKRVNLTQSKEILEKNNIYLLKGRMERDNNTLLQENEDLRKRIFELETKLKETADELEEIKKVDQLIGLNKKTFSFSPGQIRSSLTFSNTSSNDSESDEKKKNVKVKDIERASLPKKIITKNIFLKTKEAMNNKKNLFFDEKNEIINDIDRMILQLDIESQNTVQLKQKIFNLPDQYIPKDIDSKIKENEILDDVVYVNNEFYPIDIFGNVLEDYISYRDEEGVELNKKGVPILVKLLNESDYKDVYEEKIKVIEEIMNYIEKFYIKIKEHHGYNDIFYKYIKILNTIRNNIDNSFIKSFREYNEIGYALKFILNYKSHFKEIREAEIESIEKHLLKSSPLNKRLIDLKNKFKETILADDEIKNYIKLKLEYKELKINFDEYLKIQFLNFKDYIKVEKMEKKENIEDIEEVQKEILYDGYFIKLNRIDFEYFFINDGLNLFDINSTTRILLIFLNNLSCKSSHDMLNEINELNQNFLDINILPIVVHPERMKTITKFYKMKEFEKYNQIPRISDYQNKLRNLFNLKLYKNSNEENKMKDILVGLKVKYKNSKKYPYEGHVKFYGKIEDDENNYDWVGIEWKE
jgi:hypothetical protein